MYLETSNEFMSMDPNGRHIIADGKVYRAFNALQTREFAEPLLNSGLIEELIRRELLIPTKKSGKKLDGYSLLLEQELLEPVTLPFEWSFSMLQDCALAFLELSETAVQYGYYLKDAHPYNFVWKDGKPLWVDFGSFEKADREFGGFFALDEFVRYFYKPLRLWKIYGPFFSRQVLSDANDFGRSALLKIFHPGFWFLPRKVFGILAKLEKAYYRLAGIRDVGLRGKSQLVSCAARLAKRFILPSETRIHAVWKTKIVGLRAEREYSRWENYHDEMSSPECDPRFNQVVELLRKYSCRSVLELAGNAGKLSCLISTRLGISVICSDYDVGAVEKLYQRVKADRMLKVTPVCMDILYPILFSGFPGPQKRLSADAVIALAVTHHLLLSQHIRIADMFRRIGSFAKKYVLIEFMPLGFYDGTKAASVPEWYHRDWFREEFQKQFELLEEIVLGKNRILFVGKIQ